MNTKPAVLKMGAAAEAPSPRFVLRGQAECVMTSAAEPGVWISQTDLEALKARCTEQGRSEGEERGRLLTQQWARQQADREANARLEQELKRRHDAHVKEQSERWRSLANTLAGQAQALRERLEAEVTEWTFVAVSRLLCQRAADDVTATVRKVLTESGIDGPLTVLLHAQDLADLVACGATATDAWPEGIRFDKDARVGLGGCLIQSDSQMLDARLEVQLELLRKSLDNLRRDRVARI